MEHPDTKLSLVLRIPHLSQACIVASKTKDKNGLKILRLVRKDVNKALLSSIEHYQLDFQPASSLYPEIVKVVGLLSETRLSSLRVTLDTLTGE